MEAIKTKVDTYKCEMPCEEDCGGMLEFCGGPVLTSLPPQYLHKCTECGMERFITGQTFPYTYEE